MMTLKTEYQDKQGHKKLEWDHQEGQTNFKDRTQSSRSKTENNQMLNTNCQPKFFVVFKFKKRTGLPVASLFNLKQQKRTSTEIWC